VLKNNNLKKADIINSICSYTGYSKNFSKKLINDLLEIIIANIKQDNFNIKNFGLFKLLIKTKRIGRNPKTKEEFLISSRKSISFTPSKKLSENINKLK
jgi:integration host factor subunit alpha